LRQRCDCRPARHSRPPEHDVMNPATSQQPRGTATLPDTHPHRFSRNKQTVLRRPRQRNHSNHVYVTRQPKEPLHDHHTKLRVNRSHQIKAALIYTTQRRTTKTVIVIDPGTNRNTHDRHTDASHESTHPSTIQPPPTRQPKSADQNLRQAPPL